MSKRDLEQQIFYAQNMQKKLNKYFTAIFLSWSFDLTYFEILYSWLVAIISNIHTRNLNLESRLQ